MPNFNENTVGFIEYPIYYYDVTYSMSLPVRGIGGAAGVIMNGWDPVNLVPSLVHVSAAGALSVAGSISATTSATATAAAPVYVEGSTDALSMDLGGALRVTGTISASSTVKSTAAAPSYVEGSSNPFSSDLAGGLRVTGAFFQTTQPVSLASSPNPSNLDVALSTRTKPSDQQHVIVDSSAAVAVTGPLTDTQLRASAVPVSLATLPNSSNLDVALSTRTKPSDQQHVIVDSSAAVAVTSAGLTNLDVALSTRTKPADQQHVIVDSSAAIAVTGPLTDTQLRATAVPVSGTVTAADPNIDVLLSTRTKPSDQQHVIVDSSAPIAVTGTFFQTTQPVSLASIPNSSNLDVPISGLVASNVVANVLAAQQVALMRAGPAGFVPMETPGFLTGTG